MIKKKTYSYIADSEISETGNGHRALIFCQRLSAVQLLVNLFSSGELGSDIRLLNATFFMVQ